jgi:hypothetical protein
LVLGGAHWEYDGDHVELTPEGQVLEDGDLVYVVDRAGRVVDEDYEPVAILLPDGIVAGLNDRNMGRVGVSNGSPPGRASAWFSIQPDGQVIFFDYEGERYAGGMWRGCDGPMRRTCALVTQVFRMRSYAEPGRGRVGIGVGVGVGLP